MLYPCLLLAAELYALLQPGAGGLLAADGPKQDEVVPEGVVLARRHALELELVVLQV